MRLLLCTLYFANIKSSVPDLHGTPVLRDYSWRSAATGIVNIILWVWDNGGWSNPANCSAGRLPGPEDDVLIDNPSAEQLVTSHLLSQGLIRSTDRSTV